MIGELRVSTLLKPAVLVWIISCQTPHGLAQEGWRESWQKAGEAAEGHDYAAAVKHAIAAQEKGLEHPEVEYHLGCWHFLAGNPKDSVDRFDRFVEKRPGRSNALWERGISCYYVDDFKAGAQQFADYQKYHDNDVENAVWRYLCQMKFDGKEKARKAMLPIRNDRRLPMMQVYGLFKGEQTPDDVLKTLAASTSEGRSAKVEAMHAHLYLGLYYDSEGNFDRALDHLAVSAKQFEAGGYMWSVAVYHKKHLKEKLAKARKKDDNATSRP